MAIHMRSRHGGYLVTVVPVPECDLHSEEDHEVSLINSMMGDLEDLLGAPVPGVTKDFSWCVVRDYVQINSMGILLEANPGMYIVVDRSGVPMVISKSSLDSLYEDIQSGVSSDSSIIDELLTLQTSLEQAWGRLPDPDDNAAVSSYIRQTVLCATDELHELLHEVHWKPWKASCGIRDVEAYREELADVLHFILDLYLAAGLTGDDLVNDYVSKYKENMRRVTSPTYKEGN